MFVGNTESVKKALPKCTKFSLLTPIFPLESNAWSGGAVTWANFEALSFFRNATLGPLRSSFFISVLWGPYDTKAPRVNCSRNRNIRCCMGKYPNLVCSFWRYSRPTRSCKHNALRVQRYEARKPGFREGTIRNRKRNKKSGVKSIEANLSLIDIQGGLN